MNEKQFTDIEVGADTGRVRLYNGINFVEYSSSELLDLLNTLNDEIEQLKKELFEARKDYILETYADNPIRRDEKLKALEKVLKE